MSTPHGLTRQAPAKQRCKAAPDPTPSAIAEAKNWILTNRAEMLTSGRVHARDAGDVVIEACDATQRIVRVTTLMT